MMEEYWNILFGELGIISGGSTIEDPVEPEEKPAEKPSEEEKKEPDEGDNEDGPKGEPESTTDEGEEPPAGQGDEPPVEEPAAPQFGEFGSDPNKLLDAYTQLKNKTTVTEQNMAALNKTLESMGVKAQKLPDGGMTLIPLEGKTEKQKRFTDEYRELFEESHLNAISALVEDTLEGYFENRVKQQAEY